MKPNNSSNLSFGQFFLVRTPGASATIAIEQKGGNMLFFSSLAVVVSAIIISRYVVTKRHLHAARVVAGAVLLGAIGLAPAAGATTATFKVSNTVVSGFVAGNIVTVTTSGGAGSGAVTFAVTGGHCAVGARTGVLSATAAATCSVKATKAASGTHAKVTSAAKVFTFAADSPTNASPDWASLTSIYGTGNTSPLNANATDADCATFGNGNDACGNMWFLNAYYIGLVGSTQYDNWLLNYVHQGSIVKMTWHVKSGNGLALANTAVTLETKFAGTGKTDYMGFNGTANPDANGFISGVTDASGNITFWLVAPYGVSGVAAIPTGADLSNAGFANNNGEGTVVNRMVLLIGTPLTSGDNAKQSNVAGTEMISNGVAANVTQATDLVDLILTN